MPDVHVPQLDDEDEPASREPPRTASVQRAENAAPARAPMHRSKSLGRIGLEVLLISAGVFLGLMGEQWRERSEHREIAEASLRRFRTEFQTNRQAVASVKDKHVAKVEQIRAYLAVDAKERLKLPWPDTATDPAFMEYVAWDLALATQSLAYIDPDLAFSIAHVYAAQQQLDNATRAVTQSMYSTSDTMAFVGNGLITYFGDCTLIEPRLLKIYDEILPRLDRALGN